MKNILPNTLEAVFLDFDGVVIESTDIKTQAFYEIYQPYGENIAHQAKTYHIRHQGISRYEKFEAIHQQFLKKLCPPEEAKALSALFSEKVFQKIVEAVFVPGVEEFLKKMQESKIPVFLLSATPQEELSAITEIKSIKHYFKEIVGHPTTKIEGGNHFIEKFHLNPANIIFIGDGSNDLRAAEALKIPFIARITKTNMALFQNVPQILDFTELL